jgi:hypothetical protein
VLSHLSQETMTVATRVVVAAARVEQEVVDIAMSVEIAAAVVAVDTEEATTITTTTMPALAQTGGKTKMDSHRLFLSFKSRSRVDLEELIASGTTLQQSRIK